MYVSAYEDVVSVCVYARQNVNKISNIILGKIRFSRYFVVF
jgi:hypothetical protein